MFYPALETAVSRVDKALRELAQTAMDLDNGEDYLDRSCVVRNDDVIHLLCEELDNALRAVFGRIAPDAEDLEDVSFWMIEKVRENEAKRPDLIEDAWQTYRLQIGY